MRLRALERAAALVAAALLVLGLVGAPPPPRAGATISIVTHGACTACTATENRVAIQAAIDAAQPGDTVYIPPGTYYVEKLDDIRADRILYLTTDGVTIAGESRETSIIALDPVQANEDVPFGNHNSVFYLKDVADVTFRDFQIEGSKDSPDGPTEYEEAPEHHRGIFVWNSERLLVEDMLIENFTGDALQLYIEANNTVVRRCIFRWNQRDGLTLSPAPESQLTGVLVEHSELYGNWNQQVDNEHGPAHDVEIRHSTIAFADHPNNTLGFAIAGAGTDASRPSLRWNVHHNQISGAVLFVWTSESIIADNVINNPRLNAAVQLERMMDGTTVARNIISQTQTSIVNSSGVLVNGTIGGGASNIIIEDNTINVTHGPSFGIRLDGIVSATVSGNTVIGPRVAAAGYAGIRVRATVEARDVESVLVHYNDVRDFGQYGISFVGTAASKAQILYAEVVGNKVRNTTDDGPQTTGISLNDSNRALKAAVVKHNVSGCGVDADIANDNTLAVSGSPLRLASGCP